MRNNKGQASQGQLEIPGSDCIHTDPSAGNVYSLIWRSWPGQLDQVLEDQLEISGSRARTRWAWPGGPGGSAWRPEAQATGWRPSWRVLEALARILEIQLDLVLGQIYNIDRPGPDVSPYFKKA
jgi:hypothetical protein